MINLKQALILFTAVFLTACEDNQLPLKNLESQPLNSVLINAEDGIAIYQDRAGYMYLHGIDTNKSLDKALFWYKKAAEQEFVSSQVSLGLLYAGGLGAIKSCEKAINWFRRASKNGSTTAKSNWSYMLSTCDDPIYRNGELALKLINEKINEHGGDLADIDNLAAALAETGNFEEAIKTQEIFIKVLKETDQIDRLKSAERRLTNYKLGKPWRESSYVYPTVYTNENNG